MSAGFSACVTSCGGFAGAMPMSPLNRSKRIWMGCAMAMSMILRQFHVLISPRLALQGCRAMERARTKPAGGILRGGAGPVDTHEAAAPRLRPGPRAHLRELRDRRQRRAGP